MHNIVCESAFFEVCDPEYDRKTDVFLEPFLLTKHRRAGSRLTLDVPDQRTDIIGAGLLAAVYLWRSLRPTGIGADLPPDGSGVETAVQKNHTQE